jgi:histidinol phosphatase-like PHP family hydrolase
MLHFTFIFPVLYLFMMIDLHTHSILSDGELIPFELVRRAEATGYSAIAITDHVDASNMEHVVSTIARAVKKIKGHTPLKVIAGAELTHVPPALVGELVKEARALGASIVVVHGETLAEPVIEGTNRAGIDAGADILSHPGLISEEDVLLAKEKGVALEITTRKGHSISNGHVARMAMKHGAALVINTDAHSPSDLVTKETARNVLLATGLVEDQIEPVFETSRQLIDKITRRNNA